MCKKIFIFLIKVYQRGISPYLGTNCKYYPTCSEYGKKAIKKHGAFKGLFLIVKRIGRCNPFSKGGIDPVP